MDFKEIFTEGMNQNSQKGMLSREHFEKKIKHGRIFIANDQELSYSGGNYYIDTDVQKRITGLYQMYRKFYKSGLVTEKAQNDSMRNVEIYNAIKKKYKIKATFKEEDFNIDKSFDMKLEDGSKIKVLVNTTKYNKPVFWFEWK